MTQPATQAAVAEGLLTWTPRRGLTGPDSHGCVPTVGERLAVADSWLLRDGRVRGLGRHRERFLRSCGDSGGPSPRQLVDFWRDMTAALPHTGEWFPRVELGAESRELRLLLRHAPPLGTGVRVWAAGQLDPRTVPRRKGPDLDILARVRQRAATEGADEAVLIAPSGVVLEGPPPASCGGRTTPCACPPHSSPSWPESPLPSSRNAPSAPASASPTANAPSPTWTAARCGW